MSKSSSKPVKAVTWNLDELYLDVSDPKYAADQKLVLKKISRFNDKWQADFSLTSASELVIALAEYEEISELLVILSAFPSLLYAKSTQSPEVSKFFVASQEFSAEARSKLIWFELAIKSEEQEIFDQLINLKELSSFKHYLLGLRKFSSYTLSQAQEEILIKKNQVSGQAFVRLYDKIDSEQIFKFEVDGQLKNLTYAEITTLTKSHPDRGLRKRGCEALTEGLRPQEELYGFILNNLLLDKKINDELRGYKYPQQSTFLVYEIEPDTVSKLVKAVTDNYDLVEKYYKLKAKKVGDKLFEWDRYSSLIAAKGQSYTWEQAQEIVLDAFARFSPKTSQIAKEFFDKNWIDAEVVTGKRTGAFCSYVGPKIHPYVFMNFTGEIRDITTLAHELGHGLHGYLSREQSFLNFWPSTATAEIASVFAESLVYDYLFDELTDPIARINLRAEKIQSSFATVFRQIAFYNFESDITNHRRERGELTVQDFNTYFQVRLQEMFGQSLTLTKNHENWWMPVLHFYHYNFYVFSYAFGELLSQSLYALYKREGGNFIEGYLAALHLGGSTSPYGITKQMGVDISRNDFWQSGLDLLRVEIKELERELLNL